MLYLLPVCAANLFDHDHCRRGGWRFFYSIGGVICNAYWQNDKCTFEKIVYATVFNYNRSVVDTKGITHEPDIEAYKRWNVPQESWSHKQMEYIASWYPYQDRFLYNVSQSGNVLSLPSVNKTEKDGCATLFFSILGDGRYEINIKMADAIYNNKSVSKFYKRAFNVLLNDLYIAREFNPNVYRYVRESLELIVNFKVFENGKMFELQGHPSKVIQQQKFKLEMCYSFCARTGYKADPNWMMNSISIVKFARSSILFDIMFITLASL